MPETHPLQGFIPSFAVPVDTQKILARNGAKLALECDNFSLLFHRYIPSEAINKDELLNDRGRSEKTVRVWWFEEILNRFSQSTNSVIAELVVGITTRWNARTRGAKKFPLALASRLIIGLGGKNPLEIGLTIDQTTGLPYIPGSALKGLTRSYALYSIAEVLGSTLLTEVLKCTPLTGEVSDNETLTKLDIALLRGVFNHQNPMIPLYRIVFGAENLKAEGELPEKDGEAGQAIFHDAVFMGAPHDTPIYGMDVMTPHFKGWYNSGNSGGAPTEAPHDADSPNPVVFLTVNAGCQFAFAVGWRGESNDEAHRFARELLEMALQEFGIGSKTAAGYGTFKPLPKPKKP